MDKNTIIGFVLIAAVLFGFTWYNQPSQEEVEAMRAKDSIENVAKLKAEEQQKIAEEQAAHQARLDSIAKANPQKPDSVKTEDAEVQVVDSSRVFFAAMAEQTAQQIVLKNDKVELTLSSKGATVTKAVIKGFEDNEGNKDVTLFDAETQKLNFTLVCKEQNISTEELFFTPSTVSKFEEV